MDLENRRKLINRCQWIVAVLLKDLLECTNHVEAKLHFLAESEFWMYQFTINNFYTLNILWDVEADDFVLEIFGYEEDGLPTRKPIYKILVPHGVRSGRAASRWLVETGFFDTYFNTPF